MEYAFKILIVDKKGFLVEYPAQLLFGGEESKSLLNRKKQWLLDKLHNSSNDITMCRNLIDVVVTALPEWKEDYVFEFLLINKQIADFQNIHLFPMSSSWSGSEIPLILEKIKFVQSLKNRLKGIDYIEHRDYLEGLRRRLEKYKDEVELREYLEDADYI